MRSALAVWLSCGFLAVCALAGEAGAATVSSLRIQRQGPDAFYSYRSGTASIQDSASTPSTPGEVVLSVGQLNLPSFDLRFSAPAGESLAIGHYEDHPIGDGASLFVNDIRFAPCPDPWGSFDVLEIGFDTTGRLGTFRAVFEAHCNFAWSGEIRFNSFTPVALDAPSYVQGVEGRSIEFAVSAHDTGGNPAAILLAQQPEGVSFVDAGDGTGTFSWTPGEGQGRRYWVQWTGRMPNGDAEVADTLIDVSPAFDDFDDAVPFSAVPYLRVFEGPVLSPATDDPACAEAGVATAWFQFTPEEAGRVLVYSGADTTSHFVSVYEGERGSLRALVCDGWDVRVDVEAGRTYHVMVGLRESAPFFLRVDPLPTPPPNDTIENATVVTTLPFHETVQVGGASVTEGDPGYCGSTFVHNPSVWYAYTPAVDTRVTVDIPYDPTTVFRGPVENLVPVACGHQSPSSFTALAGQTYYVMTSQPTYPLSWTITVDLSGRPAFGFDVAVAPGGIVDTRSGVALVRGTVTCTRPGRVHLSGQLAQTLAGSTFVRVGGQFATEVACDGVTPWTAAVTPVSLASESRRPGFRRGVSYLSLEATGASDDDPDDRATHEEQSRILLRMRSSR